MKPLSIPLVAAGGDGADSVDEFSAMMGRRGRDTSKPVLLVGFLHQGNLGLGYLSATLRGAGYRVEVLDFEDDVEVLVDRARQLDPLLIGFSLIFQFYVVRFAALADALREAGIACHFTVGGHFASLSSAATLELMPAVDSVVRYEGELTLLELADCIGSGCDWHAVSGLAWRDDTGACRVNPDRHLIHDLDRLPWPDRDYEFETVLGQRMAPLVASRGCSRTCSFCSIHVFYRSAPGKVVRLREPEAVVAEMNHLHRDRGVNIFLFQDDDFPLFGKAWRRWTRRLIDALRAADLWGRILFKLNCRADAVEPELFTELRDAGLFIVYMGLESGNDEGLNTLGKDLGVDENLRAVRCLRELGLTFEYGFMLFDPGSSFESIRQNVLFLRDIVDDGRNAAVFCRMLPYDGTPIKDELAREGRLRGDVSSPDYDFLDLRINGLFEDLNHLVHVAGWIHGHRALSPKVNWAWIELAVIDRLFPSVKGRAAYEGKLRAITRSSNDLLFRVVDDVTDAHEQGVDHGWDDARLAPPCDDLLRRLASTRDEFVRKNEKVLLTALIDQGLARVAA